MFLHNNGGSYILKDLALVITDKNMLWFYQKRQMVVDSSSCTGWAHFSAVTANKLKKYMENVKFIITWVTQLIGKSAHPMHKDRLSSSINCLWFYEISPYIDLNCSNFVISWSFRWTWWILCLYKWFLNLNSRKNVWPRSPRWPRSNNGVQYSWELNVKHL